MFIEWIHQLRIYLQWWFNKEGNEFLWKTGEKGRVEKYKIQTNSEIRLGVQRGKRNRNASSRKSSFSSSWNRNTWLRRWSGSFSVSSSSLRVFRRRRRPRGSLARLLSDVTESCQSWLDEKVFRGVFGTGQNQNQIWDQDLDQDKDQDWARTSQEGPAPLDESSWSGLNSTELDTCSFTYGQFQFRSSFQIHLNTLISCVFCTSSCNRDAASGNTLCCSFYTYICHFYYREQQTLNFIHLHHVGGSRNV